MTNEGVYQLSIALKAYLAHSNQLLNSIYYKYKDIADGYEDDGGNFLDKIRQLGIEEEKELIKFLKIAHQQTGTMIESLTKLQPKEEQQHET